MSNRSFAMNSVKLACVAALSTLTPSAVGAELEPKKPQFVAQPEVAPLADSTGALGFTALSASGRVERCHRATVSESISPWLERDFIYLDVSPKRKSATRILVGVDGVAPKIQPECRFLFSEITVTYDVAALNRSSRFVSTGSFRRRSNNTLTFPFRKVKPVAPGRFCVRQYITAQTWSGEITPFGEWASTTRISRDLRVRKLASDKKCAYN